jgi:hypothetical protein
MTPSISPPDRRSFRMRRPVSTALALVAALVLALLLAAVLAAGSFLGWPRGSVPDFYGQPRASDFAALSAKAAATELLPTPWESRR